MKGTDQESVVTEMRNRGENIMSLKTGTVKMSCDFPLKEPKVQHNASILMTGPAETTVIYEKSNRFALRIIEVLKLLGLKRNLDF